MFLAYGLSLALSPNIPIGLLGFSLTSIIYGLIGFYSLYLALRKTETNVIKILKNSSFVYLFIFVVASFDVGMVSGQELMLIIFVSMFLLLNWMAVKAINNRRTNT
jgi:hypothetical protein